jgi:hypothetical protein
MNSGSWNKFHLHEKMVCTKSKQITYDHTYLTQIWIFQLAMYHETYESYLLIE